MLQRLTEDLEYHELLDKAVKCESSTEQMCFVAAFSVSSYSTTVHRTAKPFNPLLGETYELDRLEELGFRSLCEQVSPGLPGCWRPALPCGRPGIPSPCAGLRPETPRALLELVAEAATGTARADFRKRGDSMPVPALQSRRWGRRGGRRKVPMAAGSPGSLPGAGLPVTAQRLRRKVEAVLTRAPSQARQ